MSAAFRILSPENQQDAIDLLNRTSADTSLKYDLDIFGFRWLARYWNFSYEHSLILYVDGEPAAVMINCVESRVGDAFCFYWGVLRKFRNGRIAFSLVDACCRKLRQDGYAMHFAAGLPERPARRYRFVHFEHQYYLVDMEAASLNLPAPDGSFVVREVAVQEIFQRAIPSGTGISWCQTDAFLQRAAPFLKFFAAFSGEELKAYAAVLAHVASTTVSALHSAQACTSAGVELLRTLHGQERPPLLKATDVFEESYAYQVLTAAGLQVNRRFSILARDLRTIPIPNAEQVTRWQSEPAPVEQSSPKVAS